MSEVSLYVPKENGDLKFLTDADIDDGTSGALLVDAFLDENPRNQDDVFVIIDQENGVLEVVEVEDREPIQPKRKIVVRTGGGRNGGSASEEAEDTEEERPQTRRAPAKRKPQTKKSSGGSKASTSKPKPRGRSGNKGGAKPKARAKSGGSKPKGGAFARKAEDD
jgi:hypothetical protein